MILSRTPFRISFFGGGTDFRGFYSHGYGAVLGTTIDKYMYVMVNHKFDGKVRASYSVTENVNSVSELKHGILREALHMFAIKSAIEIVTVADVPGTGVGLGSSSSLAVGVLNALAKYVDSNLDPEELARKACEIEIEKLGSPIGKQDQYLTAYGGLCFTRFNSDESVKVEHLAPQNHTLQELENNMMYFYTGISRVSSNILEEQQRNIKDKISILEQMCNQAEDARNAFVNGDLTKFGSMLNDAWNLKKQLSSGITNQLIDKYYHRALTAGALGGKISGAGGGGFLILYCEKNHQDKVRKTLSDFREVHFSFVKEGSKIIYS